MKVPATRLEVLPLLILSALLLAAGAPEALRAATAEQRALVREIQAYRQASRSDPEAVRKIHWDKWRAEDVECRGALGQMWSALVNNKCGRMDPKSGLLVGELVDAMTQFGEVLEGAYVNVKAGVTGQAAPRDAESVAWDGVEAVAAVADIPANSAKCVAQTLVMARYPEGPTRDLWLGRIQGITDAASLVDFTRTFSKGATKGVGQLGSTMGQSAMEASKAAAAGAAQSKDWFQNIQETLTSFHEGRTAALEYELFQAGKLLDQCATQPARAGYQAALEEALAAVYDTRRWATDAEQIAYCDIAWTGLAQVIYPYSDQLREVNDYERRAVARYASMLEDPRFQEGVFAKKDEELTRLLDEMGDLPARVREASAACKDEDLDDLIRDTIRWSESACLKYASNTLGLTENIQQIRDKLSRQQMARREFFDRMDRSFQGTAELLAECRFQEARDRMRERLRDYDERWKPDFSIATFRPCWTEPYRSDAWPPDALEEAVEGARAEIADLREEAVAALGRAAGHREACEWIEAQEALDQARGALGRVACPADSPEAAWTGGLWQRVDESQTLLEATRTLVEEKMAAWEGAKADLLDSMEEEVFKAEQPREAGRCAAADSVIEMEGIAGSILPPRECPGLSPEDFLGEVRLKAERARRARELGIEEFGRFQRQGEEAAGRCDIVGMESALAGLGDLPVLCGPDAGAAMEDLRTKVRDARRETDFVRSRIDTYEQEWAAARDRCDIDEMGRVANAIAAWKDNPCAANLTDIERGRIAALAGNTPAAVQELAARKEAVVRPLNAKNAVAEGYIRTLSSMQGQGDHAVDEVRRIVADAREFISFVHGYDEPDLPLQCYEPDLDNLREKVPELERLIAGLDTGGGGWGEGTFGEEEPSGEPTAGQAQWGDGAFTEGEGGGRPAGPDTSAEVAAVIAATGRCDYITARAGLNEILRRDPGNAWAAENLAEVNTWIDEHDPLCRQGLNDAQAALGRGDLPAANLALALATRHSSPCMKPQIEAIREQVGAERDRRDAAAAAEKARQREETMVAIGRSLGDLIDAWSRARTGSGGGGGGTRAGGGGTPPSTPPAGGGATTTRSTRRPCSIGVQVFPDGDTPLLVKMRPTSPSPHAPDGWIAVMVPSRKEGAGDTGCFSPRACLERMMPGVKEGYATVYDGWGSLKKALMGAWDMCPEPVNPNAPRP